MTYEKIVMTTDDLLDAFARHFASDATLGDLDDVEAELRLDHFADRIDFLREGGSLERRDHLPAAEGSQIAALL